MRIALLGPGKFGLYRHVVFICRWSLGQVRQYMLWHKRDNFSISNLMKHSKRSNKIDLFGIWVAHKFYRINSYTGPHKVDFYFWSMRNAESLSL